MCVWGGDGGGSGTYMHELIEMLASLVILGYTI